MRIVKTNMLSKTQKEMICHLWNREYPRQLATTPADFDTYLQQSTEHNHFLVLDDVNEIVGWAYTFNRDDERWFSILINSLYQRLGIGSMVLNLIKEKETSLSGWVIDHPHDIKQNGDPYESPIRFYIKNDFIVDPDIRFEDEKLSSAKIKWKNKQ